MLFSRSFSDVHRTTVFLRKREEKDELAFGVTLYFDIAENLKEVTRLLYTFHSAIYLFITPTHCLRESHNIIPPHPKYLKGCSLRTSSNLPCPQPGSIKQDIFGCVVR